MISADDRQLLHHFIVVDLLYRTLQRDGHFVHYFKMERAFSAWFEQQQNDLQKELKQLKVQLSKRKLAVLNMQVIDEYFCKFKIVTPGEDMELHYSNHALKSDIEAEVQKRLGTPPLRS